MSKATTAIIVGIAAIGLITFVSSQANGQAQDVLVTDHDSVYDYKLSAGRWYTRKKKSATWIDMKNALSESNYYIAIIRLNNHLKNKPFKPQ